MTDAVRIDGIGKGNRFFEIDLLRALALCYIIFWHIDDYTSGLFYSRFTHIGAYISLGLFIYISGFLLSTKYDRFSNKKDILLFALNRLLRIYPLYVFALLVFYLASYLSEKSLIIHIFLMNIPLNDSVMTLWFVSLICLYYIAYPLLVHRYSVHRLVCIVTFMCILLLGIHFSFGLIDPRLILFLPVFGIGIASGRNGIFLQLYKDRILLGISVIVFFIASFIFISASYESVMIEYLIGLILMISGMPLIHILAKKLPTFYINNRIVVHVSYASFCMYLFHRPIFLLMSQVYSPSSDIITICYLIFIGFPITYIVSEIIQYLYDYTTKSLKLCFS